MNNVELREHRTRISVAIRTALSKGPLPMADLARLVNVAADDEVMKVAENLLGVGILVHEMVNGKPVLALKPKRTSADPPT